VSESYPGVLLSRLINAQPVGAAIEAEPDRRA